MPDSTVGHYELRERIGAGAMGEVYRARDQHLDRDVALKILPAGLLNDEAARNRLRREALALSKLNHPNVATIFDFATCDGVDFLAMELVVGSALTARIEAGAMEQDEVVRLGVQLLDGLAAAHRCGVIHRDLKPGNLMVTSDGRLKILDFGVAIRAPQNDEVDETRTRTELTSVGGTVAYMAPEQLRGSPGDERSDLYAVGAVLYELATGRKPFPQSQSNELIGAILHQPIEPARRRVPSLSPEFDGVVMKALDKEPSRRFS